MFDWPARMKICSFLPLGFAERELNPNSGSRKVMQSFFKIAFFMRGFSGGLIVANTGRHYGDQL
jgi:hypothetical protein